MDTPFDDTALNELLSSLESDDVPIDPMPSLTLLAKDESAEPDPETATRSTTEGIWTRQPEETTKAYKAFCVYRDLGPSRSLNAAYRQAKGCQKGVKRASGHWTRWHRDHDWRNRAEAYDKHLDQIKREAEAQKWRQRGEQTVERQFALGEAFLKKAEQMLQFPLVEKTVTQHDEHGNEVAVTIEPARWTMNSAARLFKVGVEMMRLAAGLPTKHEQSVQFDIDPSKLTDEQIERILAGEHPAAVIAAATPRDSLHAHA